SRRSAAAAAQSAMSEDSRDLDELLASPKPRGRPKKAAAGTSTGRQTTPSRARKADTAPPDTAGMLRRARPAAKEADPSTRRSPRAAKAPARKPRTKATAPKRQARSTSAAQLKKRASAMSESESESESGESDHGSLNLEELSISDDAMPETPTRTRGGTTPSLVRSKLLPVVEIEVDESIAARRGRKRKSDAAQSAQPDESTATPPAKRGRPRKIHVEEEEAPTSSPGRRGRPRKNQEEEAPAPPSGRRGRPRKTQEAESPPASPARRGRPPKDGDEEKPHRASSYEWVRMPPQPKASTSKSKGAAVDIQSPSKFESSRSKIRTPRQRAAAGRGASSDEAGWRAKYEELLAKRQSQPEEEYKEFREKAQERFDAAEDVIKNLRKEVASLKRQGAKKPDAEAQAGVEARVRKTIEKEFEKEVVLLRQQVERLTQDILSKDEAIARLEKLRKMTETSTDYNLRRKLGVMEEVTGLAIDDLVPEDDGISYVCRQAGPTAAARYVLTAFEDLPSEYQYTPIGDTAVLPTYLHQPISFERAAASMFYWRVCSHLRQPADEDMASTPQPPPAANGAECT
ncbi:hypothetical protein IWW50_003130, partial [Coemansia erecta]